MKIAIRTDSSTVIGTGHVMRCLTFAEILRRRGAQVYFICRDLPGNIAATISDHGFGLHLLPYEGDAIAIDASLGEYERWLTVEPDRDAEQTVAALLERDFGADCLIVDHYALDADWQRLLRTATGYIMVIDDLPDRRHDCDLLLDQNLQTDPERRCAGLVRTGCRTMLGPRYALLRREFTDARRSLQRTYDSVRRVLIFYGGADTGNETGKALRALECLNRDGLCVDVVVGQVNAARQEIWDWCASRQIVEFHENVHDMAALMARADLAIGAGGTTTWERCCLGLPTIVTAVADNQVPISKAAATLGVVRYLGQSDNVSENDLVNEIEAMTDAPSELEAMSRRCMCFVDGDGGDRIVNTLYQVQAERVEV